MMVDGCVEWHDVDSVATNYYPISSRWQDILSCKSWTFPCNTAESLLQSFLTFLTNTTTKSHWIKIAMWTSILMVFFTMKIAQLWPLVFLYTNLTLILNTPTAASLLQIFSVHFICSKKTICSYQCSPASMNIILTADLKLFQVCNPLRAQYNLNLMPAGAKLKQLSECLMHK